MKISSNIAKPLLNSFPFRKPTASQGSSRILAGVDRGHTLSTPGAVRLRYGCDVPVRLSQDKGRGAEDIRKNQEKTFNHRIKFYF